MRARRRSGTPTPTPARIGRRVPSGRSRPRERRVVHRDLHRHAGTARCGRSSRCVTATASSVALVSAACTVDDRRAACSPQLRHRAWHRGRPWRSPWPRPGSLLRQPPACGARRAGSTRGARPRATSTTTPCCMPCAREWSLVDRDGRVQLANDEARRLLDLRDDAIGRRDRGARAPGRLGEPLARRRRSVRRDPPAPPSRVARRQPGSRRELRRADGSARSSPCATTPSCSRSSASWRPCAGFADVAARPGPRGGQPAAHRGLAGRAGTRRGGDGRSPPPSSASPRTSSTDAELAGDRRPELAALLLAKVAAAARARASTCGSTPRSHVPARARRPPRDLVTIVGNLIDNAIDACPRRTRPPLACCSRPGERSTPCCGSPTAGRASTRTSPSRAFTRGWSTKEARTDARAGSASRSSDGPSTGRAVRSASRAANRARVRAALPHRRRYRLIRTLVVEDDAVVAAVHA